MGRGRTRSRKKHATQNAFFFGGGAIQRRDTGTTNQLLIFHASTSSAAEKARLNPLFHSLLSLCGLIDFLYFICLEHDFFR